MPTTSLPSLAHPETLDGNAAPSAEWDGFLELENKILSVADALRQAREERDQARAELGPLRAAHDKLQQAQALAERELMALRKERNDIRQRVARLVAQVETAVS